jgi:hypothetical protein
MRMADPVDEGVMKGLSSREIPNNTKGLVLPQPVCTLKRMRLFAQDPTSETSLLSAAPTSGHHWHIALPFQQLTLSCRI